MTSRDYYKILGIHPEANEQEIKDAYRELVRLHHPDSGQRSKDKDAALNNELFKAITEAYATLINPQKRKEYDYEHSEINPQSSIHWLKKKPNDAPPVAPAGKSAGSGNRKMAKKNTAMDEKSRLILICIFGALFGIFCALLLFAIAKLLG